MPWPIHHGFHCEWTRFERNLQAFQDHQRTSQYIESRCVYDTFCSASPCFSHISPYLTQKVFKSLHYCCAMSWNAISPLRCHTFSNPPVTTSGTSQSRSPIWRFRFGYNTMSCPAFASPFISLWPCASDLSNAIRYTPNGPQDAEMCTYPPVRTHSGVPYWPPYPSGTLNRARIGHGVLWGMVGGR